MALIGLALGSWFYCYGRGSVTIEMKRWQLIVLFLPPLLVVLWSLLQASTISPGPWNNPIWREASQALATDIPGHVSLTPDKAAALLARLGMYAGVFWLAANLGRDPENARNAIATTGWAVTVIAFYGLVVYFSGAERILWMRKYAYIGDLTATFVNRNNYATFAGMGLVCVVARAFNSIYDYINISKNKLERTRNFISFIERRGAIYLLQVLIIFSSILLSHSRAGLVSTICGVFVIFVAFSFSRLDLGKLPLRATIAFVVVGIVFYAASGQGIDARLGSTDIAGEERPLVYQLTIRAISDQPLFGTGLGSFEDVFRLYRSAKVLSVYDYAHDTYLETALELGVPSLILLALSIGAAIIECARGVRVRRRDLIYPCIGVGVSGLVWTHALVDFSIQIPAVAVSYAMLMGIAVAQSRSSRE
jgi:O-antigen ligase